MQYNELKHTPAVFAIENEYQIIFKLKKPALVKIKVGDKYYADHSNGVLKSSCPVHKISVPMSELDKYKKYTLCIITLKERLAYFSKCHGEEYVSFDFTPVPEDNIKICHLADVHGKFKAAEQVFKKVNEKTDLLVLNGDVIDHSGNVKNFDVIYKLCELVTHGNIPVVFSRGNHDLRGIYAEKLEEYIPTRNGKTYYTFRLGSLWAVVLDTGEDKADFHEEYGNTVCCEIFREDEEKFLNEVVNSKEYLKDGITHRIVIVHSPFTYCQEPPFDIERPRYRRWVKLIADNINPEFYLCGHVHISGVFEKGSEYDNENIQSCPVILGSEMDKKADKVKFGLAFITLTKDDFKVDFYRN